ncbi:RagB/SusD family nutrient uptake outer membrane protein [Siphonobacter sp.]|uniref:RagB/SusD family nutrient uptake outer membrane protein n=1 Tax=Siphonobacter sp. TaxID=1869184 RepID=UPI003B3B752C
MKMNQISKYLLTAGLALSLTACDKDYLETQPTDAVSEQSVFTSIPNAWAALNGIHRQLYSQQGDMDQAGQMGLMIHFDALGDDVVMTSTGNGWYNGTYRWTMHRSDVASTVRFTYLFYYKLIANANMIIANIDKITGDEKEKNDIKAQALTYRAWSHFMLVQLYGQRYEAGAANTQLGVPIMVVNTTEGQSRATVAEVYTQVNKDLDEAIALFGTVTATHAKSHFNISSAKGMQARVALTMGEWTKAATLAKEARAKYTLMSQAQYLQGFNNITNPEWIWGSSPLSVQTTYFHSFFAFMSGNFNSTNIRTNPKAINSKLYATIAATDVRKQLWDPTGKNTAFPVPPSGERKEYMNRKFLAESSSSSLGDVVYMRAAEMYLIEAEALAHAGKDADAAKVLYDLVVSRDPSYTQSTATGTALLNEILTQRRVELWGEGFRFFDLKRLNQSLDRTGTNHQQALALVMTIPAGDSQWQYLFPRAELNVNPNIVQNP